MRNTAKKETASQPLINGDSCLPVDTGLLGTYEKRITKINAHLVALEKNKQDWSQADYIFLKSTYIALLKYYRSLIHDAHSGLVDELTPESF